VQQLHMSARAYHRILKLSRTIADLAGSDGIQAPHVARRLKASRCDAVPAEARDLERDMERQRLAGILPRAPTSPGGPKQAVLE
jgi:hypothetical protein